MVERCAFINGDLKCKKKLKLTDLSCRCQKRFCSIHRMPENHKCEYDYKNYGKKLIKKILPEVTCPKVIKI